MCDRLAVPGGTTKLTSQFHWGTHLFGKTLEVQDMFVDFNVYPPVPFKLKQSGPPEAAGEADMFHSNTSYVQFTPMDTTPQFDIDPDSYEQCELAQQCQDQALGRQSTSKTSYVPSLSLRLAHWPSNTMTEAVRTTALDPATESTGLTAAPPPFVADYSAVVENYMVAAAGPVTETADTLCCEPDSLGQCQVMLSHSHGPMYRDTKNQRMRREDQISGRIFVDFYHDHTEPSVSMLVNVTGGVETCQEWCPLNPADQLGNFTPWQFHKGPLVDAGATTILGQSAERYTWKEGLVHLGVYTESNLYAKLGAPGNAAIPILLEQTVNMLGRVGEQTNTTYTQFVPGVPPATKFKIAKGPADGCPQSSHCSSAVWQAHRQSAGQYATHAMFA